MSNTIRFSMLRLLAFAFCLTCTPWAVGANKPSAAFLDLSQSPVATVLEAKLLERKDATWIERTEIAKVLEEQKLQALFAPEAITERTKLGRLIKADLLILVRQGKQKDVAYIDLTVAEVSRGLRLAHGRFPLTANPDFDATGLLALIEVGFAKQRTALGAIYAVPPFLSKDLFYEYDDLRQSYAHFLESQLSQQPNALVVELAEAEKILQELSLAGEKTQSDRSLPYYLLGEYRNEGSGDKRRVKIQLVWKQGSKTVAQSAGSFPPDKVGEQLIAEVTSFMQKIASYQPSPSNPQLEAEQLYQSALSHYQLGDYEEAVSLAEASLLLKPHQEPAHSVAVRAMYELVLRLSSDKNNYTRAEAEKWMSYRAKSFQHIIGVYNNFDNLKYFESSKLGGIVGGLIFFSSKEIGKNRSYEAETNHFIARTFKETMFTLFEGTANRAPDLCVKNLYPQLILHSDHERVEFRKELLLKFRNHPNAKTLIHDLLAMEQVQNLNKPHVEQLLNLMTSVGNDVVKSQVELVRKENASRFEQYERSLAESKKPLALPIAQSAPNHISFHPLKLTWYDTKGNKGDVVSFDGLLATDAGFDIAWHRDALYLIKGKGDIKRIFSTGRLNCNFTSLYNPRAHSTVCYDGKYIWAAFYELRQPTRLLIINPQTEEVSEPSIENGLPDPNKGSPLQEPIAQLLSLAPLAPGRVVVAGGFGRAWVAEATFSDMEGAKLKLIHEAKETSDQLLSEQWKNSMVSFNPMNSFVIQHRNSTTELNHKTILLGRHANQLGIMSHPLCIDPQTLTVSVCPAELFSFYGNQLEYGVSRESIYSVRPDPSLKRMLLRRTVFPGPQLETVMDIPEEGFLLFEEERIHVVGKEWWVVDLTKKTATSRGSIPWRYMFRWALLDRRDPAPAGMIEGNRNALILLARSNIYGLMAIYWDDAKNIQITQVDFANQ